MGDSFSTEKKDSIRADIATYEKLKPKDNHRLVALVEKMRDNQLSWFYREKITENTVWFVWDDATINRIVEICKGLTVTSIACGRGFYEAILIKKGLKVNCIDSHEYDRSFCDIAHQDINQLTEINSDVLLTNWADYCSEYATHAVKIFTGNIVIYTGENQGGCVASDSLFDELDANWELIETLAIPQWWGIRDFTAIYHRKA